MHRIHRRRPRTGQALIETALTLPLMLMLGFIGIDVARFFYLRGVAEGAVHRSERSLVIDDSRTTDCLGQSAATAAASGLNLGIDGNSVWGDASAPSAAPNLNQGLLYIYPAVAQTLSTCAAAGGHVRPSGVVTTYLTYSWVPATPVFAGVLGSVTLAVSDTEPTQY